MATPESLGLHGLESKPDPEPVTDELVAAVESRLGVKLPDSYVSLLRVRNGGYVREHFIEIGGDIPEGLRYYLGDGQFSVGSIFGIAADEDSYGTLAHNAYLLDEWDLPKGLVLIDGDGHTWFALDYRVRAVDPPVVFVASDGPQILTVAPSFADFLHRLQPRR
jgi:hypothetical protein